MNERYLPDIKKHLQSEEAQARVRRNMLRGHEEATVTIGRAARLFNFTENQLRDWEDRSLLKPLRPTGQRQYSPAELDKLAIIRELLDAKYSPGDIPADIDEIWNAICLSNEQDSNTQKKGSLPNNKEDVEFLPINQRIERARADLFWRFFISHTLRLSLMLICEDIPHTPAGLVLPLRMNPSSASIRNIEDLPQLGESLVGWFSRSRSSHTLLTSAPSFQYSTDYRLLRLQVMNEDAPDEDASEDNTLIIVDRRSKPLTLSAPIVETIRRLLAPLYEEGQNLWAYFGPGMRDVLDPATDFSSSANYPDIILTDLAEMILRLGGRTAEGKQRWRFCCILLPKDTMLPWQQRSLVVRAKSKEAPAQYRVGVTTLSPGEPIIGLSLRAFQSGSIIYRSAISREDFTVAFREAEDPIHSAMAVPVGGEDGQSVAVLYIASDVPNAFSSGHQGKGDQRVLRMMSRMVEELLRTYDARLRVGEKLAYLITNPGIVDASFKDFASENEFINDVEILLAGIQTRKEQIPVQSSEIVSFIAIDIDNQSAIANRYGDLMTRNLSKEVGQRIEGLLRTFFTKFGKCRLYHMYADRFYLFLKDVQLEQEGEEELLRKAEQLRKALEGQYQINAQRTSLDQPVLPDSTLTLTDVTVRLGVTLYTFAKLGDVLRRYSPTTAVTEVRSVIVGSLDDALKKGMDEGGNVVIAWDTKTEGFVRWSSSKNS